jgi:RIO-like serine/threonine protein kinase
MDLIKENKQKRRSVYKLEDRYRKVWSFTDQDWLDDHISMLEDLMPGFVLDYKCSDTEMYIDYKIIPGTPASKFEHTPEFMKKIYNFCLDNINETQPYAHGDWVLSNIIVDDDKLTLIDWDNVNLYPPHLILEKLHDDLKSAFGDKFDPASL